MIRKNKNLKSFYSRVYSKKGEARHYTKLVFGKKGELPSEEREVLREINWRGKNVLDFGCGTGLLAYEIAKRGAKKVVGLDFSPAAIEAARAAHHHPRLTFLCENILRHRGKYDVIVSLGTLEHMDDPFRILARLKKNHLTTRGILLMSCPNWTNPRGYILQTLWHLFRAPITKADLHYLTPIEFTEWAKKLGMTLSWRTIDFDWAHGERLIRDFERRLPNVLRDAKLPRNQRRVNGFIKWIREHVLALDHTAPFTGATGIYRLKS